MHSTELGWTWDPFCLYHLFLINSLLLTTKLQKYKLKIYICYYTFPLGKVTMKEWHYKAKSEVKNISNNNGIGYMQSRAG